MPLTAVDSFLSLWILCDRNFIVSVVEAEGKVVLKQLSLLLTSTTKTYFCLLLDNAPSFHRVEFFSLGFHCRDEKMEDCFPVTKSSYISLVLCLWKFCLQLKLNIHSSTQQAKLFAVWPADVRRMQNNMKRRVV